MTSGYESGPPPAPPRPPRNVPAALVFGLIGAVVGALLVGGAWLIVGENGGDGPVGNAPISAPAKLGDYPRLADVELSQTDGGKRAADRVRDANQRSVELLSATYGGAATAIESYADDRVPRTRLEVVM